MGLKYHTVIFVPHARARFRKWKVTNRQLQVATGAALFLVVASLFTTWSFFTNSIDRNELEVVAAENEDLREINRSFETSIGVLQKQLAEFEDQTRQLAIVAGLDSFSPSSDAGIGGLSSPIPAFDSDAAIEDLGDRASTLSAALQAVGVNLDERERLISSTPSISPVKGLLTSGYGYRRDPITGNRAAHWAIDIAAAPGQTVQATAVPLIAAGATTGVLVVWRHSGNPFDGSARDVLESLAPHAAAALTSADRHGSMTHMALVDGLTSLGNRRRLDHDLASTLQNAVAAGLPVAFAMVDIDHFKNYNDTHGHGAGDEALRQVASVIAANVRETDIVYRYGGEEFSILLPGTNTEEAEAVAERVRTAVQQTSFPGEQHQPGGSLTVSVGVATLAGSAPDALKARADAALYDAKSAGRNRVVIT